MPWSSARFLPWWFTAPMVAGTLLILVWQENRRPLRRATESKLRRQVRNFAIAGLGAAAVLFAESPLIQPLAGYVESSRWGLLGAIRLPPWVETAVALVLMDYTFYLWHVLMHRVPLLWRFHAVHHVDLGLD